MDVSRERGRRIIGRTEGSCDIASFGGNNFSILGIIFSVHGKTIFHPSQFKQCKKIRKTTFYPSQTKHCLKEN